jgi:cytochrome c biogenesis protein CcmG/thiol:disulfide interchange protein DsbE
MRTVTVLLLVILSSAFLLRADDEKVAPEVAQAISQGDAFLARKDFEKARDAYHRADKLAHHTCAYCFLRLFSLERNVGDLSAALDYAKKALAAAGDNKSIAALAHLVRSTLLTEMAGKPGDKKLKEAEEELRDCLALDPRQVVAQLDLGIVLLKQMRDAEGLAELNKYIATPGADPKAIAEAQRIIANPIRGREPFAPDFAFVTLEGANVTNATLHGKVVLLDFWGTWCPPCRASVPMLVELHKKFANRPFEIVGISSDHDEVTWKNFVAKNQMAWPEYIDLSGKVLAQFKVHSFPTFIVIDREGVIRFRQSGVSQSTAGDLVDTINKAIKKPFTAESAPKETTSNAGSRAPGNGTNSISAGGPRGNGRPLQPARWHYRSLPGRFPSRIKLAM